MAFNVSELNAYVNETAEALVLEAVATGKTIDLVDKRMGLKGTQALNFLTNNVTVQSDSCGHDPSGTVAFKQRNIEVCSMKVNDTLCPKTLEDKYLGQWMKPGPAQDLSFMDFVSGSLADSYVKEVKRYNELLIWKGDKLGTPGDCIDGIIALLSGESDRVLVSVGTPDIMTGDFTLTNIIEVVSNMYLNVPEEIAEADDLTLFMSLGNFRLYTEALRMANLFHYNIADKDITVTIPGTNVKVVATTGLTGTDNLVLTPASNIVIGMDLMNQEEQFKIWYSEDEDEVRVRITWKLGVQVFFPEYCVTNF